MRTILCAIAASSLCITPAAAQFWSGTAPATPAAPPIWGKPVAESAPTAIDPGVGRDLRALRDAVRDGRQNGQLTRQEARALRRAGHMVERLEARFRRGGLSASERAELAARGELLRDDIVAKRSGVR